MKTKKILIFILVLISFPLLYTGAWFYAAHKMDSAILQFYNGDAPRIGIKFLRDRPTVTGFPGPPTIEYKTGFETDNLYVGFKKVIIKGFPIPGFPVTFRVEDGPNVFNKENENAYPLNTLVTIFTMPASFPKSLLPEHLQAWQQKVGKITIKDYMVITDNLYFRGSGHMGLDENLSPDIQLTTTINNYPKLINFFVYGEMITPLQGALMLSAFNALAGDGANKIRPTIDTEVKIEHGNLFFGPVNLGPTKDMGWF